MTPNMYTGAVLDDDALQIARRPIARGPGALILAVSLTVLAPLTGCSKPTAREEAETRSQRLHAADMVLADYRRAIETLEALRQTKGERMALFEVLAYEQLAPRPFYGSPHIEGEVLAITTAAEPRGGESQRPYGTKLPRADDISDLFEDIAPFEKPTQAQGGVSAGIAPLFTATNRKYLETQTQTIPYVSLVTALLPRELRPTQLTNVGTIALLEWKSTITASYGSHSILTGKPVREASGAILCCRVTLLLRRLGVSYKPVEVCGNGPPDRAPRGSLVVGSSPVPALLRYLDGLPRQEFRTLRPPVDPTAAASTTRAADVIPGSAKVSGSLNREVVRRIVSGHINEIKYCYKPALARTPGLSGLVQVKFKIAETGMVIASELEHSSLRNNSVEDCVVQAVRRWEFPMGDGIVWVSYPFNFSPGRWSGE
jgi:TonB family protein